MATVQTYFVKNPDGTLTNVTLNANGTVCVPSGSATAPAVTALSSTTAGLYYPNANEVAISTNGSQRVTVDSSGRVGVGTASPVAGLSVETDGASVNQLHVQDSRAYNASPASAFVFRTKINTGGSFSGVAALIAGKSNTTDGNQEGFLSFYTNNNTNITERARIDSSGRLLVGTSSARSIFLNGPDTAAVQVEGTNTDTASLAIIRNSNTTGYPLLHFAKTRGTTVGSTTIVQSGDICGGIEFEGSDGTEFVQAASIRAEVDGTPGANDMPGRLVFSTTADGASSPTERLFVTSTGRIGSIRNPDATWPVTGSSSGQNGASFGSSGIISTSSNESTCIYINRNNADGDLIRFYESGTQEGAISVSGTTVTYGGGHLARWSQLPNNEDPSQILKGTVMSNLDEMCNWGEEDNEQLNKTKISDVEGDKNVAGVFVSTSFSDDGPLDFFVGMTGDMVIRIAEGVTVERGDLLMSAGDGTAKPQDDDIIRSKTIAKVTSTNVSCTYEDGSYCVPCVLMAC